MDPAIGVEPATLTLAGAGLAAAVRSVVGLPGAAAWALPLRGLAVAPAVALPAGLPPLAVATFGLRVLVDFAVDVDLAAGVRGAGLPGLERLALDETDLAGVDTAGLVVLAVVRVLAGPLVVAGDPAGLRPDLLLPVAGDEAADFVAGFVALEVLAFGVVLALDPRLFPADAAMAGLCLLSVDALQ